MRVGISIPCLLTCLLDDWHRRPPLPHHSAALAHTPRHTHPRSQHTARKEEEPPPSCEGFLRRKRREKRTNASAPSSAFLSEPPCFAPPTPTPTTPSRFPSSLKLLFLLCVFSFPSFLSCLLYFSVFLVCLIPPHTPTRARTETGALGRCSFASFRLLPAFSHHAVLFHAVTAFASRLSPSLPHCLSLSLYCVVASPRVPCFVLLCIFVLSCVCVCACVWAPFFFCSCCCRVCGTCVRHRSVRGVLFDGVALRLWARSIFFCSVTCWRTSVCTHLLFFFRSLHSLRLRDGE